jgi:hypothetical protein
MAYLATTFTISEATEKTERPAQTTKPTPFSPSQTALGEKAIS